VIFLVLAFLLKRRFENRYSYDVLDDGTDGMGEGRGEKGGEREGRGGREGRMGRGRWRERN
jgi:hypothetical protein